MKSAKRLIINADDFGLHESINEAVEVAHRDGILTSASLAVNGRAFEHAVEIAKRNKNLGVGLHLTLAEERPVASPEKIKSFVNREGRLHDDHRKLCLKILTKEVLAEDIMTEIDAQCDRFYKTGLTPTHIDSHRHLHFYPPIYNLVKQVLRRYPIDKMRYLNIPFFEFKKGSYFRKGMGLFFKLFGMLNNKQYKHPDFFFGFFNSGNFDKEYFIYLLDQMKPGVSEIIVHPGKNNEDLRKKYHTWDPDFSYVFNWERDLEILTDNDLKGAINDHKIMLTNYSSL